MFSQKHFLSLGMKRILVALLVVWFSFSCTKVESTYQEIEYGCFTDSWQRDETQDTYSVCTISSYMEGEELIAVRVQNIVVIRETKQIAFEVDYGTGVLPREFRMALERTNKKTRTDEPIGFIATAKGVEITWKMFDEIYEKYKGI